LKQKKFGGDHGYYRDSRLQDGRTVQGLSGSVHYYFQENHLLNELEVQAKEMGL